MQMLSSIQGMVEKTRQSMAVLKDRVSTTQAEMERREASGYKLAPVQQYLCIIVFPVFWACTLNVCCSVKKIARFKVHLFGVKV